MDDFKPLNRRTMKWGKDGVVTYKWWARPFRILFIGYAMFRFWLVKRKFRD